MGALGGWSCRVGGTLRTTVVLFWLTGAVFLPSLRVRAVALVLGITGTALVIGLVSFGFAMTGSLLLAFVHPGDGPLPSVASRRGCAAGR
ncbi:hypothetical protein [Cellulomonas chengniuliangii]|uniref:hypothetical protein n=1 Tax=Cellulomonas chengniuliangii TaxID=2968084 RepID=UPI001D0EE0EC|nr:hypothetical protein [Cellulomonas chengniuliangii]MCC2318700.1 hypothetical protein [Cellulomonas chengniuliangii]